MLHNQPMLQMLRLMEDGSQTYLAEPASQIVSFCTGGVFTCQHFFAFVYGPIFICLMLAYMVLMFCRWYKWAVLHVRAYFAPRQAAPATTNLCVTPREKLSKSDRATGQMQKNLKTLKELSKKLQSDIAEYTIVQLQFEKRDHDNQAAFKISLQKALSENKGGEVMQSLKSHLTSVCQHNYALKQQSASRMQAESNEMFEFIIRQR